MAIKKGSKVEIVGGRHKGRKGELIAFNGTKQCTVEVDIDNNNNHKQIGNNKGDSISTCRLSLKNVKVINNKRGKKRKSCYDSDELLISNVSTIIQERRRHRGGTWQYLCQMMDGSKPKWIDRSAGLKGTNALEEWEQLEKEGGSDDDDDSSEGGHLGDEAPEVFDRPSVITEKSKQLSTWIANAKRPVFLLGAGVSSPVLPTFRGKNGLWTKNAHKNTKINQDCVAVQPTYTHRALTALEEAGYVYYCVTQNYDDLSRRSGFPPTKLSELHGNIFIETCDRCGQAYHRNYEVPLDDSVDHETGRVCERANCTGLLRDNIVHFDEALPWHDLKMANAKFVGADLTVVLGSSLRVEPAASMPFKSKRRYNSKSKGDNPINNRRPKAVIVNLQPTPNDDEADLIIRAKTDDVFKHITETLGIKVT